MKRSSAIIMPLYALPSPHGIGTMGKAAHDFVDFLADAGQSWWQLLPVGPTSFGDSPYQSPSAFAGNPYLIDLDELVADGLLTQDEVDSPDWGDDPSRVDYAKLYASRPKVLRRAFERGFARDAEKVARVAFALGAGRAKSDDAIDNSAGVLLNVAHGDRVEPGMPVARLFANGKAAILEDAAAELAGAFSFSAEPPAARELVLGEIA